MAVLMLLLQREARNSYRLEPSLLPHDAFEALYNISGLKITDFWHTTPFNVVSD
jgi:hypothetical protein